MVHYIKSGSLLSCLDFVAMFIYCLKTVRENTVLVLRICVLCPCIVHKDKGLLQKVASGTVLSKTVNVGLKSRVDETI